MEEKGEQGVRKWGEKEGDLILFAKIIGKYCFIFKWRKKRKTGVGTKRPVEEIAKDKGGNWDEG